MGPGLAAEQLALQNQACRSLIYKNAKHPLPIKPYFTLTELCMQKSMFSPEPNSYPRPLNKSCHFPANFITNTKYNQLCRLKYLRQKKTKCVFLLTCCQLLKSIPAKTFQRQRLQSRRTLGTGVKVPKSGCHSTSVSNLESVREQTARESSIYSNFHLTR